MNLINVIINQIIKVIIQFHIKLFILALPIYFQLSFQFVWLFSVQFWLFPWSVFIIFIVSFSFFDDIRYLSNI